MSIIIIIIIIAFSPGFHFNIALMEQALIIAVQYGREAAVLKLLQLGADKFIKTKTGKTAADMAKVFKYSEVDLQSQKS